MFKIPILKTGSFEDKNGQLVKIDTELMTQVVDSYDPSHFKAPLILSHTVPEGLNDVTLSASEYSFGTPDSLAISEDRVWAVFSKLSPQFRECWKNGEILSFSSGLYPPKHPKNPYVDAWSLRHVAALGKSPPAIKGLGEPVGLSELPEYDLAEGVSTPTIPAIELGYPFEEIMTSLREDIIDREGLERANSLIPKIQIEEIGHFLNTLVQTNSDLQRQIYQLSDELNQLSDELRFFKLSKEDLISMSQSKSEPNNDPQSAMAPPLPQFSQADYDKIKAERDALQAREIELQEKVAKQQAEQFINSLEIPYLMDPVSLSESDVKSMNLVEFMSTLTPIQTQFMEGMLRKLPKPVEVQLEDLSTLENAQKSQISLSESEQKAKDSAIGLLAREITRKAKAEGKLITLSEAISQARSQYVETPAI